MAQSGSKRKRPRADQRLVSMGHAETVERARALILAGRVFNGERRIDSAGQAVALDAPLRVVQGRRYVGRGGDKLEGALADFGLDPAGLVVLDVGASTGGFTDCLLQQGASKIYAVDVGRAQLANQLRADDRVISMERTNARDAFPLPETIDMLVADVSFISLRAVLPTAMEHLKPGGLVLALVKPQFEAEKGQVGRGGVVSDPRTHAAVVGGFCVWAVEQSPPLEVIGIRRSRLEGDKGNREFFVLLKPG